MNEVFHAVKPAMWSISAAGALFEVFGMTAALGGALAVMGAVGADCVAADPGVGVAAGRRVGAGTLAQPTSVIATTSAPRPRVGLNAKG